MAAIKENPYEILGIKRDASQEDIKKAYRDLMKQHHPDVAQDKKKAEDKCKEINSAYEILSDTDKRAAYDNPPQPRSPFSFGFNPFGDNMNGVFQFVNGRMNMGGMHGNFSFTQNISHEIEVSLIQLLEGGSIETKLPTGQTIKFNLPKNTEPGSQVNIRISDTKQGNATVSMIAQIRIKLKMPVLTTEQLTELKKLLNHN
jgi:DnaJ-class molecular chaperone